jgi:hypothetical protein
MPLKVRLDILLAEYLMIQSQISIAVTFLASEKYETNKNDLGALMEEAITLQVQIKETIELIKQEYAFKN